MLPDNLSLALTILVGSFSLAFFRFMHSLLGKTTPKTEDEAHAPPSAAVVFLAHLLSGLAEENEKIQVAIDRLLPVREFIEPDNWWIRRIVDRAERRGLDARLTVVEARWIRRIVDRTERLGLDARLTVVEALYGSDSQMELIRENLRLKGELFYLEKAVEVLGSVEVTLYRDGRKATLSLRDGHFSLRDGRDEPFAHWCWWLTEKELDESFTDPGSAEYAVSGVPLQTTSETIYPIYGRRMQIVGVFLPFETVAAFTMAKINLWRRCLKKRTG